MALTLEELEALAGKEASPDFDLQEMMREGQESLDQKKTATKPANKQFFSVNDIVLFCVQPSNYRTAIVGVVVDMLDNEDPFRGAQVHVEYWKDGAWSIRYGPTHYTNLTWIGNLERFGLTWKDIQSDPEG